MGASAKGTWRYTSTEAVYQRNAYQNYVVQESSARRPSQPIRDSRFICLYCERFSHQSADCGTVKESENASFLTMKKICFNCGKPYHTAEACRVAHQNVIQERFDEKVNFKDEKRGRGHEELNKAETLHIIGAATIPGENGSKEV
ncbi:zinc knuckle [Cooperia oncophora]